MKPKSRKDMIAVSCRHVVHPFPSRTVPRRRRPGGRRERRGKRAVNEGT